MSAQTSHNSTLSIPYSLKVAGIIAGLFALVVILIATNAYLSGQPDFSMYITYLSDIKVTPVWPQIGLFPIPAP
jgi:uncharacterized membrane protein YkgB